MGAIDKTLHSPNILIESGNLGTWQLCAVPALGPWEESPCIVRGGLKKPVIYSKLPLFYS